MKKLDKLLNLLWIHMHKGMIVRRIIIFWALSMSTYASVKSYNFAIVALNSNNAEWAIVQTAAIIAAILGPVLGLTGSLLKSYAQNKYQDNLEQK